MRLHVIREGGVNRPPVTGHIKEDEEKKQEGKENQQRASFSFIEIKKLMKGVPPSRNDFTHSRAAFLALDRDVSLLLNRLLARFDDFHTGDGVVQTGKWGTLVADHLFKKILPNGTNGVGVSGVGLRVNHGGGVFDPVPVTIAGGTLSADHFNHKGPGVSGMIIGCETCAEVGKGLVTHFHGDHGEVFLGDGTVIDGGFHAGNELGLTNQIKGAIGMVGKDLPNDSRVTGGDFFGVVDVNGCVCS